MFSALGFFNHVFPGNGSWTLRHRLMECPLLRLMEECLLWTFFTMRPKILEEPRLLWRALDVIEYRTGGKAKSACGAEAKPQELLVVPLIERCPGGRSSQFKADLEGFGNLLSGFYFNCCLTVNIPSAQNGWQISKSE